MEDEIQACHWNNQQCSLHLIILYYRKENESDLVSTFICFISDDLKHKISKIQLSDSIAEVLSKVHYFSDRCTGQYKNCTNVFANSHGKSPCDGIGGTVK